MQIDVDKEYIDFGVQSTTASCPLALALQDQLGVKEIRVGFDWLKVRVGDPFNVKYHTVWDLPKKLQQFVSKFDHEGAEGVEPFKFTLPDSVVKKIKKLIKEKN